MGQQVMVYGIDLGTTNSCIALIDEHGMPVVRTNSSGQNTTPSVVSYEEGSNTPFVGETAKEALKSDPTRTVAFIKREIGNPNFKSTCEIAEDPIRISSYILKKLVADANELNGLNIKDVVITCPAYFGTNEKEQTKQAGIVAGLNVLSIINEPTAAALSYGFKPTDNKAILVYDLGGGTFDVSIMRTQGEDFEVIASDGDHRLGGMDWDTALAKYIAKEANIKIDFESKSNDKEYLSLRNLLLLNAEIGKKALKDREKVVVNIPYKGENKQVSVTRELLDQLTATLLDQTIEKVHDAIKIATGKGCPKIDEVILVGGSSRMLQVKKRVDNELGCNAKLFDPDMAVAKGAALFAMALSRNDRVKFRDTSAHGYGIECYKDDDSEDLMVKNLILAQSLVVCSGKNVFEIRYDGQSSVKLPIYESTSQEYEIETLDGKLLVSYTLDLKKGYPKGTPIYVTLQRTAEGILKLFAEAQGIVLDVDIPLKGKLTKDELATQTAEVRDINVG